VALALDGYADSVPLRVLHLSTYSDGGGAARAANAVNRALESIGVDSRLISAQGPRFEAARRADRMLWKFQQSSVKTWRSPAQFGSLSARDINASSADIVNLHWVTDGFLSIEEIGKIQKPVVMSLYDMWAFCGTEHYGVDSPEARWRIGYTKENRPADERGWDIDRNTWERKRKTWSEFQIITASTWLTDAARDSSLFESWPVTRIPHPIDPARFEGIEERVAKQSLGLDPARPVIGFVASAGVSDQRKGFDLLAQALEHLPSPLANIQLLIVGPRPTMDELPSGFDIRTIGSVKRSDTLVAAYSASDVLAVPSREDNMPLTAMEAQMCGTPVVAFNVGGLPDIIMDGETGFLAPPFDVQRLARSLAQVLTDKHRGERFGAQARNRAEAIWGFDSVAKAYLAVYLETLDSYR